MKNNFMYKALQ